jgi:protein TonB
LLASRDLAITSRRAVEIAPPQDTSLDSKPQRVTVGRLLFNPTPILDGQNGQGDSGSVEILASIGLGGQVLEAKVVGGSAKFGAAAMSAIREWLYEPTLVDGRPVPSQDDLRFVFGHP